MEPLIKFSIVNSPSKLSKLVCSSITRIINLQTHQGHHLEWWWGSSFRSQACTAATLRVWSVSSSNSICYDRVSTPDLPRYLARTVSASWQRRPISSQDRCYIGSLHASWALYETQGALQSESYSSRLTNAPKCSSHWSRLRLSLDNCRLSQFLRRGRLAEGCWVREMSPWRNPANAKKLFRLQ